MNFISSRNDSKAISFREAFWRGRAEDGGAYLPADFGRLSASGLSSVQGLSFREGFAFLLSHLLPEIELSRSTQIVQAAFPEELFGEDPLKAAPLNPYNEKELLWLAEGGPSGHALDFSLALGRELRREFAGAGREDKLVLCGDGTMATALAMLASQRCLPEGGENSEQQAKLLICLDQRATEEEREMISALLDEEDCGIFLDEGAADAEFCLLKLFSNPEKRRKWAEKGFLLQEAAGHSPLSLVTDLILLILAFARLEEKCPLSAEDPVDLYLPLYSFGPLLAAFYGKELGLPIRKIIVVSGRNKIFPDFLRSGRYSLERRFFKTCTPSLDRLLPAGLEAVLFELCGRKRELLEDLRKSLAEKRLFEVPRSLQRSWELHLASLYCEDRLILRECRSLYDSSDYLLDSGACAAFASIHQCGKKASEQARVLVYSAENPLWNTEFSAKAIFNRQRTDEAAREELIEECGLYKPALVDVMKTYRKAQPELLLPVSAEELEEKLADLLSANRGKGRVKDAALPLKEAEEKLSEPELEEKPNSAETGAVAELEED